MDISLEQAIITALSGIGMATKEVGFLLAVIIACKFYIEKRLAEHVSACTKIDTGIFNATIKPIHDTVEYIKSRVDELADKR